MSGRRGSNSQPTAWKAVTLPLSYFRIVYPKRDLNPHASLHQILSLTWLPITPFGHLAEEERLELPQPFGRLFSRQLQYHYAIPPNKNKNVEITRLYGISFVTLSIRCNPKGSSLIHKPPEQTAQSVRYRYLLFKVVAFLLFQRYYRLSNFPRPCEPFIGANLLGASFNQIHSSLRLS